MQFVLDEIPLQLDIRGLMRQLRIREGSRYADELLTLVEDAQAIGRPRGLYRVAFIESRGEDWVAVDGIRFTSRVLRVNLEYTHRVFAFVATCGRELAEWSGSMEDMLRRYWSDAICEAALHIALQALHRHIDETFRPGTTASMAPGSLPDWPIEEQRPLFQLLGDPEREIGVRLSESLLMIPTKSVSGLRFATRETFESCMLCPRPNCPGRRALYDELAVRKYRA
ncbi:MAG: vitamin B12 dependent methionine synthase [Anaerolineae bacterium]|nr:vitamin B12 dependent methionine synthase [Anaerolineae bacterium]